MKSFDDHLADCRSLLVSREAVRVPVAEALGLVLAEDVVAAADSPPFASSAMDGYAVRVADVPGTLVVAGEVAAGSTPSASVDPGTAVRVMTGSPLPEGAEAVVPVEETECVGQRLAVLAGVAPGRHIRRVAEDLHAGEVLLPAGRRLWPAQVAAAALVGDTVLVRPRPRVAVVSTGDELVAAGADPGAARLVDSNGPALAAAAATAGADVVHLGRVGDDPDRLRRDLDALTDVDLIVTSGGVGMGAYDVVKMALGPLGITFAQVAIQPGRPQAWGRYRGGPAFLGLPGNPVAALVSFELFGRAVLGAERPVWASVLADGAAGLARGRRQLLRARQDGGTVRLARGHGSHLVAGLARCDCLVVVPEDVTELAAGASVEVMPLGP